MRQKLQLKIKELEREVQKKDFEVKTLTDSLKMVEEDNDYLRDLLKSDVMAVEMERIKKRKAEIEKMTVQLPGNITISNNDEKLSIKTLHENPLFTSNIKDI